jgi:hypothetical protein
MSSRKRVEFIWFDGCYWKLKYETVNKDAYENKSKELRVFSRWQISQGKEEYKRRWPKEKDKNKNERSA